MNDEQPTQPLTDAELEDIRNWHNKTRDRRVGALLGELDRLRIQAVRHIDCNAEAWAAAARVTRDLRAELDSMTQFAESLRAERDRSVRSCGELGVELDRLRADLSGVRTALINAHEAGMSLGQDVERLRNEATGTTLGHLAKIDRLQSERDALVRKLGLDWGPDEFGDLSGVPDPSSGDVSDEYHTHNELYEYRMLYNAHAARGWLASGHRVVKSWRHSDGELCFGGGWFVVVAELPTGQVTNHYEAEHWELFEVPEKLPTAYDGHSPAEAAHRLRQALGFE